MRAFGLVDREAVPDERDPSITTACLRLHRLVREVAASRGSDERGVVLCTLIRAMAIAYPGDIAINADGWYRARRLDGLVIALVGPEAVIPESALLAAADLIGLSGLYKKWAIGTETDARTLFERSLTIAEIHLGADHRDIGWHLNNLALTLMTFGELNLARTLFERSLAIAEREYGVENSTTAVLRNNLGGLLMKIGDLAGALDHFKGALDFHERNFGADDPGTAKCLGNLGGLMVHKGDFEEARRIFENQLAIYKRICKPGDIEIAQCLHNLGGVLVRCGDLDGARPLFERAFEIRQAALGEEHPFTVTSKLVRDNLASLNAGG